MNDASPSPDLTAAADRHLLGLLDRVPALLAVLALDGRVLRTAGTLPGSLPGSLSALATGQPLAQWLGWDDTPPWPERLAAAVARVAAGSEVRLELPARGGQPRLALTLTPLADAGGHIVQVGAVVRSVGGELPPSRVSPAADPRVSAALEGSPVVLFTQGLDLRYSWSSSGCLGYRPEDVIGRTDAELFERAEDAARLTAIKRRVLATGEPARAELCITHAGEPRWFDLRLRPLREEGGAVSGLLAMALEVTDRKGSEDALRLHSRMLDAVGQAVIATDLDGHVNFWNRAAERLYGWPREEAQGRPIFELTCPAVSRELAAEIFARLAAGECWQGEFDVQASDGRVFPAEVTDAPVVDADGRLVAIIGVSSDLTERKRVEAALRESDRRKDEFLAILAHELRNPLAPIRNAVEILKLPAAPEGARAAARDMIERQVAHMVRLIDDLLDVSRITRGKLELRRQRVTLAAVLEQAQEACRGLIVEAGQRLVLAQPPAPVELDADPVRLAQVFANLLSNAARYGAPGGVITMTATLDAGVVEVSVADTGVGIAAEHLPQVFEMFAQIGPHGRSAGDGLGIGLGLARRLVELHGGEIRAASAGPDQGSRFSVRLPVLAAPTGAGAIASPPSVSTLSPRRILVVDDNRDAAASLAMLLQLAGHRVDIAHDGEQAVAAVVSGLPDLILLDLGMPRLDGYAACRQIRALPGGAAIRIVALTGWGQEQDRRRTRAAGFDGHLVKPVEAAALPVLLAELLG